MTTITQLRAEHEALGKRIAALEAQSSLYPLTLTMPELRDGERYVGAIITPAYMRHTILLPGDNDPASWPAQMKWAQSIDGVLPDCVEGALLHATMKDEFQGEWYWLCELHVSTFDYAWYQDFGYGTQGDNDKGFKFRARAVRHVEVAR